MLYSAGMSDMPASPLPRLASIDRSQLLLHTLDVERLIDEDHSSARELARQCDYEPGLQWLCGLQPVSYRTLSGFRSDYQRSQQLAGGDHYSPRRAVCNDCLQSQDEDRRGETDL